MHMLVLGGTGQNGQLIIANALARGHTVTALARNPDGVTPRPGLTVVKGSPTSQPDIQAALQNPTPPDAIIFALGLRRTGSSPFAPLAPGAAPDFLSASMKSLLAAVAAVRPARPPKLVINSSLGVGPSWAAMFAPFRLVFRYSTMRVGLLDHGRVDGLVRAGGLPFVLARPAMLAEGPAGEVRVWPDDGKGIPWLGRITRESVAAWLVDAAETTRWDNRAPVITN